VIPRTQMAELTSAGRISAPVVGELAGAAAPGAKSWKMGRSFDKLSVASAQTP
jgi:hypothetical protein